MIRRNKIILYIILAIIILLTAKIAYFEIFKTCGNCGKPAVENPSDTNERLNDPNLLYASFSNYGLCRNNEGEEGGCSYEEYLYLSGKLVTVSGWAGSENKVGASTTEKQLSESSVGEIIKAIKDSGLMAKSCGEIQPIDASWSYHINLDGIRKEFKNPSDECEDIFDEIDNAISSAADDK